jgi:lysophospholipase L1-like esterase
LIQNLEAGQRQTIVAYGTSLTANATWVAALQEFFETRYPSQATVLNRGQGAASSKWGLKYLPEQVIQNTPNTLFLEFAINDAFQPYQISVEDSRQNLRKMLNRVLRVSPNCEIVLLLLSEPHGVHRKLRPDWELYYSVYREVARERGLLLIDLTAAWKPLARDPLRLDAYFPDGIHLSPLADREIVTPGILEALGVSARPK